MLDDSNQEIQDIFSYLLKLQLYGNNPLNFKIFIFLKVLISFLLLSLFIYLFFNYYIYIYKGIIHFFVLFIYIFKKYLYPIWSYFNNMFSISISILKIL